MFPLASNALVLSKVCLAVLASVSTIALYKLIERERLSAKAMKWVIVGIFLLKFACIFFIYALHPSLSTTSDSKLFYLQEALWVIDGKTPDVDFSLSYSFLFPYLIASFVYFWHSAGAICLLMTCIEALMVWRFIKAYPLSLKVKQKAAIFYLSSYLSLYFVSLTGYNGIILCCALVFAFGANTLQNKIWLRNVFFQLGFWLSKLLMVLFVPVLVITGAKNIKDIIKRGLPLLVTFFILVVLYYCGVHIDDPVTEQKGAVTGGNIPFLILLFDPTINPKMFSFYTTILLGVAFAAISFYFYKLQLKNHDPVIFPFKFISVLGLVFLLLSKKALVHYIEMFYFILIVTLILTQPRPFRFIIILCILNIMMPLELHFESWVIDHGTDYLKPFTFNASLLPLLFSNLFIIAIYLYLIRGLLNGGKVGHVTE